jgi:hypothetical protein
MIILRKILVNVEAEKNVIPQLGGARRIPQVVTQPFRADNSRLKALSYIFGWAFVLRN